MTIPTTLAVIQRLAAAYPRAEVQPDTIRIYVESLADVDPQMLMDAAQDHINASKWFPTIAEIRDAARAIAERKSVMARIEANQRRMIERADDERASPETIEATRRALGLKLRGME